jgi:hypothetical protein
VLSPVILHPHSDDIEIFYMKQTASKSPKQSTPVSPGMKSLIAKTDKAEKAALQAYADFEKKQNAYKEALQNDSAKNVLLQVRAAMKIARLTYKIKQTEYKLAKSEYKFAKKAAKKADQKAGKEVAVTAVAASKPKMKKVKESKNIAA